MKCFQSQNKPHKLQQINQKIMDIESELKKINTFNKRETLNRNFSSVFEGGINKNMTSSDSIDKKLSIQKNSRPVSAYVEGALNKSHTRKFTQDQNPEPRQLSIQERGVGILKPRKTNPSMGNLSQQSTEAPTKINKHKIIKNWIQERYN